MVGSSSTVRGGPVSCSNMNRCAPSAPTTTRSWTEEQHVIYFEGCKPDDDYDGDFQLPSGLQYFVHLSATTKRYGRRWTCIADARTSLRHHRALEPFGFRSTFSRFTWFGARCDPPILHPQKGRVQRLYVMQGADYLDNDKLYPDKFPHVHLRARRSTTRALRSTRRLTPTKTSRCFKHYIGNYTYTCPATWSTSPLRARQCNSPSPKAGCTSTIIVNLCGR